MPKTMRNKAILIAALICGTSQAACITNDSWRGADKITHASIGLNLGALGALATGRPEYGLALGASIAAAKEIYDLRRPGAHTCSLQDFAVTVGGAALGAYGSRWIVGPGFVGWRTSF